jgi:hypothetical protein
MEQLPALQPPSDLAPLAHKLPAPFLINQKSSERFSELFAANIGNGSTPRAYYKGTRRFSEWCEGRGLLNLAGVKPIVLRPLSSISSARIRSQR